MNFIADEGVEREIVDGLRAQGHEVLYVAEMSPAIKTTTLAATVTDFGDQLADSFSVVSSGMVRIRRRI